MEGKNGFFKIVLLFVVTLLILVIAVLAYLLVTKSNPSAATNIEIVKDKELGTVMLYDNDTPFNLQNSDPKNTSYVPTVTLNVELAYFLKPKNSSVSDPQAKVELYLEKIKQLVVEYMMTIPRDKAPEMMLKAGEDLKKEINDLLNENETKKADIIYEVTFSRWFIV